MHTHIHTHSHTHTRIVTHNAHIIVDNIFNLCNTHFCYYCDCRSHSIHPDASTLHHLASFYHNTGRISEAKSTFTEALRLEPHRTETACALVCRKIYTCITASPKTFSEIWKRDHENFTREIDVFFLHNLASQNTNSIYLNNFRLCCVHDLLINRALPKCYYIHVHA